MTKLTCLFVILSLKSLYLKKFSFIYY